MNLTDVLVGVAIGDAFGAGVEFMDRDWIRANVDFTTFVNARHLIPAPASEPDVFIRNYTPWDYTDDTEMTNGMMKALLSGHPFSTDLVVEDLTNEYQDGYRRKGYGRNGHGSMRWVFNGDKTMEEVRAFQKHTRYPGNAPAVWAIPLGFLPEAQRFSYAVINADATHPHPKARAASLLIAQATHLLLINQIETKELIPLCIKYIHNLDAETEYLLQQADTLPQNEFLTATQYEILCGPQPIQSPLFLPGINGVPSDAMHTAVSCLYILKHSTDAMDGLKQAIRLGGDVDSIASVCTGILAGRYGLDSVPDFMKIQVEEIPKLKEVATQFAQAFINGK